MIVQVNMLAILVAAIVSMVLGYVWYGPLFGKIWSKETGVTQKEMMKNPGMKYGLMFVGSLLMAYVLKHDLEFGIYYLKFGGVNGALAGSFYNWLGFIVPVYGAITLTEKRSFRLFAVYIGYYLVSLLVMGVILVMWP